MNPSLYLTHKIKIKHRIRDKITSRCIDKKLCVSNMINYMKNLITSKIIYIIT